MKTLALATDDEKIAERIDEVVGGLAECRLIVSGRDPQAISALLDEAPIDALCMQPGTFDEWLVVRALMAKYGLSRQVARFALFATKTDSAFVYRVLAYGVDDVVDLSNADDVLGVQLETLAHGRTRACDRFIIDDVEVPPVMAKQAIFYSDDVDRKIVPMLAIGYTDREIARVVNYSHQTIRNRVSRILLMSGLRNRTHLAARYTLDQLEDRGGGMRELLAVVHRAHCVNY